MSRAQAGPAEAQARELEQQNLLDQAIQSTVEQSTRSALEQMVRGEIDIQISTAKRYPRSISDFYRRAKDMIGLNFETADSCIYCRPVGDGKDVEGESIRLAEIVASCYGNIRHSSAVIEMTERYVKTRGTCHDLETNNMVACEWVESTVGKNGRPYSERQRALIAQVAQSKAQRNAVFRVVPKALCAPLVSHAYEVIAKTQPTIDDRRRAILKWIESLKIDASRVWAALGIKGKDDLGEEQIERLRGIKTAIKDGDVTISEAFPGAESDRMTPDKLADKLSPAAPPAPKCSYSKCGKSITGTPFTALGELFCDKACAELAMP